MVILLTAIRYLQRKHILPTGHAEARFETDALRTHRRPINRPYLRGPSYLDESGKTSAWPNNIKLTAD